MTIRVMLVDDQALLRAGFRMVLEAQPDMEVVGEAEDGQHALELLRGLPVDVVLMDVRMPRLDGVEATRRICRPDGPHRPGAPHRPDGPHGPGAPQRSGAFGTGRTPDASGTPKVLILTTFDLDEYAFAALRAGAAGFLLKDVPPNELLTSIRAVHSGDAVVAPSTTRRLIDRFTALMPAPPDARSHAEVERLTEREREVLLLIAEGLSNGEIAGRLVLSEATVKTHVGRVLNKLELRDRVQAVVLAYESGLVRAGGNAPG